MTLTFDQPRSRDPLRIERPCAGLARLPLGVPVGIRGANHRNSSKEPIGRGKLSGGCIQMALSTLPLLDCTPTTEELLHCEGMQLHPALYWACRHSH